MVRSSAGSQADLLSAVGRSRRINRPTVRLSAHRYLQTNPTPSLLEAGDAGKVPCHWGRMRRLWPTLRWVV